MSLEEKEALKKEIASSIHVSMPGTVIAFDSAKGTATIRPALRRRIGGKVMQLPLLRDVPVFLPRFTCNCEYGPCAMVVQPGDSCLVVFADTCIDGWFESGSDTLPPSDRMHDLSDGFAFVGIR